MKHYKLFLIVFLLSVHSQAEIGISTSENGASGVQTETFEPGVVYTIKEKSKQKYQCRCFIWSKKNNYRSVHSILNNENTTSYFIEDRVNGAIAAIGARWNPNTSLLKLDDAPTLIDSKECFNSSAAVKIVKKSLDNFLVLMNDFNGKGISVWVHKDDLERLDQKDPNYSKKIRPRPILQECMS